MRPYQIAATEKIIKRVEIANDPKLLGTKSRRLHLAHHRRRQNPHQLQNRTPPGRNRTRRQGTLRRGPQGPRLPDHARYNSFQADSVSSTGSTRGLSNRLADRGTNIVVTTIHKLSNLITAEPEHPSTASA